MGWGVSFGLFWWRRGGSGSGETREAEVIGKTYIFGLGVALEVGLDGFVLLVELGQIWDEIFDDVGVG